MLAEGVLSHLDRALEYIGDAVVEGRAAIAGLSAAVKESVPTRRPAAPAKVREIPKPPVAASDLNIQRAASALKARGLCVTEQSR
jgi:hypothetical protein